MRIFIIGPEGSGKTVFLTMLSLHVAGERNDLLLEPLDYASSQYVSTAQAALEKGEWPPSTRQGELKLLKWRFGQLGKPLHEMEMFDSAGQDLRAILLKDTHELLTEEQRTIRCCIDESDFLIFLLDLECFIGSKDINALNESAWLFKAFLTQPTWRKKKRIVILSKADLYSEMLEKEDGNLKELIKRQLPTSYSMGHLVDAEKTVNYLAVTSITTVTVVGEDGNPTRVPLKPLRTGDMQPIIHALLEHMAEGMSIVAFTGCVIGALAGALIGLILSGVMGMFLMAAIGMFVGRFAIIKWPTVFVCLGGLEGAVFGCGIGRFSAKFLGGTKGTLLETIGECLGMFICLYGAVQTMAFILSKKFKEARNDV